MLCLLLKIYIIVFTILSCLGSQAISIVYSTSRQRGITNLAKQKTRVIATRVTERYAQVLEEYARKDAYINCADLLRDALREKLQRDAPDLCKTMFEE